LCASGLTAGNFVFYGFLPSKGNQRRQFLEKLRDEKKTMIFYESPARVTATLEDMYEVLGNYEIVIGRELTKIHEEIKHGKISDFLNDECHDKIKGEFTIILQANEEETANINDAEIERKLLLLLQNEKLSLRDAVSEVVKLTGLPKKKVYSVAIKLRT